MSKQRKIGEVFLDELTGKRLKCVEKDICEGCFYDKVKGCSSNKPCLPLDYKDWRKRIFIKTDEPLTAQP